MSVKTYIVDAFTNTLFQGNPAAVCLLTEEKPTQWLQQVAAEFNLSETAFIHHQENNVWHLRWFTPTCEIKLCGHATLASAHVIAHEEGITGNDIIFSSLSGILFAKISDHQITLDFPRVFLQPLTIANSAMEQLVQKSLSAFTADEDIILELEDEAAVINYQPPLSLIASCCQRGLIITAPSATSEFDFVSRFFAPNAGILEDPVTGSAHCALASFWSKKLHKKEFRAKQLSKRTGTMDIICHETRVELIGECVTFAKGELR
jgi:PhzF family phenazine biosynthesis protein